MEEKISRFLDEGYFVIIPKTKTVLKKVKNGILSLQNVDKEILDFIAITTKSVILQ